MSTPEELIPFLQEVLAVFLNKFHDLVDLDTAEASCTLENDGIEPKLGNLVLALHVNVRRLRSIEGHEEEPISPTRRTVGIPKSIVQVLQRDWGRSRSPEPRLQKPRRPIAQRIGKAPSRSCSRARGPVRGCAEVQHEPGRGRPSPGGCGRALTFHGGKRGGSLS